MDEQTVVTTSGTENTEQQNQREAVQQKYERLYNGQGTEVVQTDPVVTSTSSAVPDSTTQLLDVINSLKAEVAALKPKPAEAAPVVTTPWFEQLRQGNFEGAEADLVNRLKSNVTTEATRQAVAEAVETMRVQMEIDRFLIDLRGQNPDIAPMERYLRAPVEGRLASANTAGKIKSTEDYVREYKFAVDEEVKEMRKVTGQYRAAGKQEATTRNQQVISSSTLQPQSVSTQMNQQGAEEKPETVQDYLALRRDKAAQIRGMGFK